jgi:hypothetical protein
MQIDLLSAAVGGVVFWLLGWAAKHLLDRLVLPKIFDWWARQNARWALKRAEQLLHTLEIELKYATDIRQLVVFVVDRLAVLVLVLGVLCLLLTLKVIENQMYPDYVHRHLDMAVFHWLTIAVPLVFGFFLWVIYYANRRLVAAISDPIKRRDETITRLTSLLKAAGLSEAEIKDWLERVPLVRTPEPRRAIAPASPGSASG